MSDNVSNNHAGEGEESTARAEQYSESSTSANGKLVQQISDEVESRMRSGSGQYSGRQRQTGSESSEENDDLVRQVGDEMEYRLRSGKLGKIEEETEEAQRDVRLHHRLTYGSAVFFAIVLMWYGLEEIIPRIPVINTGPGAVVVGAIILVLSGSFFRSLFGVYLPTK